MNKYIIGLDIGTASVGWSVINKDKKRIEDIGVRIFEIAETPKEGDSLNKARREKRGHRRLMRRKNQRLNNIKNIFIKYNLLTEEDLKSFFNNVGNKQENHPLIYRVNGLDNKLNNQELFSAVYNITKRRGYKSNRKEQVIENALSKDEDEIKNIEDEELKNEIKEAKKGSSEGGAVLKAIVETEKKLKDSKSRTLGEYLYKIMDYKLDDNGKYKINNINNKIRNESNGYNYIWTRKDYENELNLILTKQLEYKVITEDFKKDILSKAFFQRPFSKNDSIEKLVAYCQFEKEEIKNEKGKEVLNKEKSEKRAPKASLTFQEFVLWQNLHNNTKISDSETGDRELTFEEKSKIFSEAFDKAKITYTQIRKLLNLSDTSKFKYLSYRKVLKNKKTDKDDTKEVSEQDIIKDVEKKTFFEAKYFNQIKKILNIEYKDINKETKEDIDNLSVILTFQKDESGFNEKIEIFNKNSNKIKLNENQIKSLFSISFSDVGHLSIKAMNNILKYMSVKREGIDLEKDYYNYTESLDMLVKKDGLLKYDLRGSNQTRTEKLPPLPEIEYSITSPIVKRSLSQTIKVVNAIINKYGQPFEVHIELAREIAKNHKDRKVIEKRNEENKKLNDEAKEKLKEQLGNSVSDKNYLAFKLYKEQDSKCLYCGRGIELDKIQDNYSQVDHILPLSRSGDDSQSNKVLSCVICNQEKGNLTPFEWFGSDNNKWNDFVGRIEALKIYLSKKQKLTTKKLVGDIKDRMLNDTRHATSYMKNYIENNLKFMDSIEGERNRKKVIVVNGTTTSYLRKRYGLNSIKYNENNERDNHLNHALDAIVVGIATESHIQTIAKYDKAKQWGKYYRYKNKKESIEDKDIKEISDIEKDGDYNKDGEFIRYIRENPKHLPQPWDNFRYEVEERMKSDVMNINKLQEKNKNYDEDFVKNIKPIFVSRAPNRKGTGGLHGDTISTVKYENQNKTTKTIKLQNITLEDLENSLTKDTDKYLYKILKKVLEENNNDLSKYNFNENPIRKGEKENSPIVKSIKVWNTFGSLSPTHKGAASNGEMVRVDIYIREDIYYTVPVYVKDIMIEKKTKEKTKRLLPEAKIGRGANQIILKDIDHTFEFIFSLYPNDLVRMIDEKNKEIFAYYVKYGISNGAYSLIPHSQIEKNDLIHKNIGQLKVFEKYQVDVLGNYYKCKK